MIDQGARLDAGTHQRAENHVPAGAGITIEIEGSHKEVSKAGPERSADGAAFSSHGREAVVRVIENKARPEGADIEILTIIAFSHRRSITSVLSVHGLTAMAIQCRAFGASIFVADIKKGFGYPKPYCGKSERAI